MHSTTCNLTTSQWHIQVPFATSSLDSRLDTSPLFTTRLSRYWPISAHSHRQSCLRMSCFGAPKRKNGTIPAPDYRALAKLTNFSKTELQDMFSKYEDIADTQEGTLTKSAFISIPELLCCPVAAMVFDKEVVEKDKETMDFTQFCVIMDLFSKNAAVEDKMKYLFELVRTTEANHITRDEYFLFYKDISAASHISSKTIDAMVNQVWPQISVDGRLDRKRFASMVSPFELHSIMTVEYV